MEHKAKINLQNKGGNTPLHIAVSHGNLEIVEAILKSEENVDLNIKNNKGKTPHQMDIAKKTGNKEIINIIRSYKRKDEKLLIAIKDQNLNKTIKAIELGADANVGDKFGRTALHIAVKRGNIEIIQLLLNKKAAIDCQDNDGYTPLHLTAYFGAVTNAKLLLENKAKIDIADKRNGRTPLMIAAFYGKKEVVKLFLESGANVNITDKNGDTPLHIAVSRGNLEIVEAILKRKDIDLSIKNNKGEKALDIANSNKVYLNLEK